MQFTNIPIINYHKLEVESDIGLTTRHPNRFERDLQLLSSQGYKPITFVDLANNYPVTDKTIIITFDDGYESVYTRAFPLMNKYQFKGVVFMPVDYIDKYNDWDVQFGGKRYRHLSLDNLHQMHKSGFEIGSHCLSHRLLLFMNPKRQFNELSVSRNRLEDLIGTEVFSVSYPFGRFNGKILQKASKAGYRFGVGLTSFRKVQKSLAIYALRRFNIYHQDSDKVFLQKIAASYNSGIGIRDWLIQKGGMGTAIYQSMFLRMSG
jgi:peptidoglycan/xylan/chitin deacetylase (PgdA/CDA1 family)